MLSAFQEAAYLAHSMPFGSVMSALASFSDFPPTIAILY